MKIIRIKANLIFANTYFTSSKIIQDLKNMFNKFDKIVKLATFLYNFKFNMVITNPKKTFNKFFAKSILIIISLDFTNYNKISNF